MGLEHHWHAFHACEARPRGCRLCRGWRACRGCLSQRGPHHGRAASRDAAQVGRPQPLPRARYGHQPLLVRFTFTPTDAINLATRTMAHPLGTPRAEPDRLLPRARPQALFSGPGRRNVRTGPASVRAVRRTRAGSELRPEGAGVGETVRVAGSAASVRGQLRVITNTDAPRSVAAVAEKDRRSTAKVRVWLAEAAEACCRRGIAAGGPSVVRAAPGTPRYAGGTGRRAGAGSQPAGPLVTQTAPPNQTNPPQAKAPGQAGEPPSLGDNANLGTGQPGARLNRAPGRHLSSHTAARRPEPGRAAHQGKATSQQARAAKKRANPAGRKRSWH
jgi:hypothetical protein